MSKFDNRSESENKGRSGRGGPNRKPKRASEGGDKSKPLNYKAKRSFTKNKSFRDDKGPAGAEKPRRSFSGSDERKPFKKDFSKDKPSYSDRPKRSFSDSDEKKPFKKSFGANKDSKYGDKPKRSFSGSEERKPFKREFGGDREERSTERPKRSFSGSEERKPFKRESGADREERGTERPKRVFSDSEERKPFKKDFDKDSRSGDKPRRRTSDSKDKKPYKKPFNKDDGFAKFKKPEGGHRDKPGFDGDKSPKRRLTKPRKVTEGDDTRRVKYDEFEDGKAFSQNQRFDAKKQRGPAPVKKQASSDGLIRLNKYLSNAGVASRREADNLILSGVVKVNGEVVATLGAKVNPTDKVTFGDASVRTEKKVYLLLNKPKDYITTVDDPKERKTVMELVSGACRERIYPVGRLDRNTTGLLLFTNDGEMTTKLTHPKFGIKKVYHVSLNKGLKPEDFKAIIEGVELEDGIVKADDLAFVGEGKKEVGIEIHSGRNRIVRRIFEHLGYDVLKLDRVVFAGLTKKDLPRGKHRFLTGKEISFLQMIG